MWSYSFNPANSAKDQVRFLIGDTSEKDPLLHDEEIEYVLSLYNNTPMNAAIRCCETIISKFSRMADESVGQVKINFSQKAKTYGTTLQLLSARLAKEDATPFAGGISNSDKRLTKQDPDRVKPDFEKHMQENDQIAPWTTEKDIDPFDRPE